MKTRKALGEGGVYVRKKYSTFFEVRIRRLGCLLIVGFYRRMRVEFRGPKHDGARPFFLRTKSNQPVKQFPSKLHPEHDPCADLCESRQPLAKGA